jgi:NAD(P)H-dependent flavin oxidoreductase YrpB (nitropropane dioxygenase family)
MGVGVSSWRLAQAVARTGQLGVVSGTALDAVVARTLQDGDPGGHIQRALHDFPLPDLAERVIRRYYRAGGRHGEPYVPIPRLALRRAHGGDELAVVGNFAEVWLAKEGHSGVVGINFLEKIQMATPAAAYGAMLAGVDFVLMGAGIPREIPHLLDELTEHRPGMVQVDVAGGDRQQVVIDPQSLGAARLPPLRRPAFLAIVSSHVLAQYLNREDGTRPDGFVVEGPRAGGHNAPPRGRLTLDDAGQPIYGPRDDADLEALTKIGLPFWLAGGYGEPEKVRAALAAGAAGVQVGTLFALSRESGLDDPLREQLLQSLRDGTLQVRTDAAASPTGFPFKVAQLDGTLADHDVYARRPRLCDLGYLRQPYLRVNGSIGYRCPAEPVDVYVRKGGTAQDAEGAQCLCNALMADVGLGQDRKGGYHELPLLTLGADLVGAKRLDTEHWLHGGSADGWSAAEAIAWLVREVGTVNEPPPGLRATADGTPDAGHAGSRHGSGPVALGRVPSTMSARD